MTTIQDRKAAHTLTKKVNYSGYGIITRAEFIEKSKSNGCTIEAGQKFRIQWNRLKYNRMDWDEQKEYEKKCAEKVPAYWLWLPSNEGKKLGWEITKAEFDYFNSLA